LAGGLVAESSGWSWNGTEWVWHGCTYCALAFAWKIHLSAMPSLILTHLGSWQAQQCCWALLHLKVWELYKFTCGRWPALWVLMICMCKAG